MMKVAVLGKNIVFVNLCNTISRRLIRLKLYYKAVSVVFYTYAAAVIYSHLHLNWH